MALSVPDFRFWLGHAPLAVVVFLYVVATLIAFVVIRWSYASGVSIRLSRHDNNAG